MSGGASGIGWWRRPGWARPLPPLVVDGLLAGGLGLLSVTSALSDRRRGANIPTLGLVLLVALVPALLVRRRLPGTTLAAVAGLQVGMLALGMPPSANFAAELVAPYSVAAHGSRRVRLAAAAAAGVALVAIALLPSGRWSRGDALALMIAGAGAWLLGSVLRDRRAGVAELAERTARLERERELEARRAAAEERLRIARELHDVVAHNLSVVVVQAQAAQRILDRDTDRARGVVVSIERTGREALDEMRRLLGVLRAGKRRGGPALPRRRPGADRLRRRSRRRRPPGRRLRAGVGPRPGRHAGAGGAVRRRPGRWAPAGRRLPGARPAAAGGRAGMSIRVLLADDQPLLRTGFRMILEAEPDIEVVGEAGDGESAVRLARRERPDVVLMDIRMPVMDGVRATRELAREDGVRVLILTTFHLDEYVVEALRAGASGFLLKDVPATELTGAIRVVAAGDAVVAPAVTRRLLDRFAHRLPSAQAGEGAPAPSALEALTDRELGVLRLVARGLSNAEVAAELVVTETTVKTHVHHLLTKLGLRDRVQLVVVAYEAGLVLPGSTS